MCSLCTSERFRNEGAADHVTSHPPADDCLHPAERFVYTARQGFARLAACECVGLSGCSGDSVGVVTLLALDYEGIQRSLHGAPARDLGTALANAAAERYQVEQRDECALVEFEQSGVIYWFDLAVSAGLPQADRTVAAWTLTPQDVHRRDISYQRGFPMTADERSPVDRGHLIPHLSGGEFGPNIFRQDRALNRGWSEEGRLYRALERQAAGSVGALYFGHLLYADETDYPTEIEIAVLIPGTEMRVELFNNRPGKPTPAST